MELLSPRLVVFFLLVFLLVSTAPNDSFAENAPCRFENSKCSCVYDSQGGGTCWAPVPNAQGLCLKRACMGGWSCQCTGRTHLCAVRTVNVLAPSDPGVSMDSSSASGVPCAAMPRRIVSKKELRLGFVKFGISYRGVLADDCTRFAWYLNGHLMGEFNSRSGMRVQEAINRHHEQIFHSKLEIRGGDVIAFRFLKSSYYCFTNLVQMAYNGTIAVALPETRGAFHGYYVRKEVAGWADKNVEISESNSKSVENEAGMSDWIPWRVKRFWPPFQSIEGRKSYWRPISTFNPDDKLGDWYFRLRVPSQ